MNSFGAIDLYSGSHSISGSNLFQVDKNPLSQLNEGTSDVLGKQAQNTGTNIWHSILTMISQITGIDTDTLGSSQGSAAHNWLTNLTGWLGGLDLTSHDPDWLTAAENFFNDILHPTGLVAAQQDLSNAWQALFGSSATPGTGSKVLQTSIQDLQDAWQALFGSSSNPTTGSQVQQSSVSGLTALWDNLFGTTTPGSGSQILQTAVKDLDNAWTALFGSSSDPGTGSQVLQASVQDLEDAWTALFGSSSSPTSGSKVLQSAVQDLETDLSNAWTALFGSSSTPGSGSKVLQASIQDLETDLSNAWTALFGSSSTPASNSLVPQTSINGLTTLWNNIFGTSTPSGSSTILQTAVQNLDNVWNNIFGSGNDPTSSGINAGSIGTITIGTVTDTIENHIQTIVDAVAQAVNGGTGTYQNHGNSPGTVLTNLATIPQGNTAVPNAPTTTTVAVLASGAGATNTGTGHVSVSWTDTIPTGTDYVVAIVNCATTASKGSSCAITSPSTINMIPLTSVSYGGGSPNLALYGLANPPTGSVTFTGTSKDTLSVVTLMAGTSISLTGVGAVQDIAYESSGSDVNPSLTTSYNSPALVIGAISSFGTLNTAIGLSGYNHTQTYHSSSVSEAGYNSDLLAGYVTSPSSPSFSATVATVGNLEYFGAVAIALNPSTAASIIGSGFRRYRASTTNVSITSGNHPFTTFFDTTQYNTADTLYNATTGVLTIGYTGHYSITIHVLETNTISSHFVRTLLYKNGSIVRMGPTLSVTSSASGTYAAGATFNVYCQTGDTLQPGYWASKNVSNIFTGESTGAQSYWEVSLTNRSLL